MNEEFQDEDESFKDKFAITFIQTFGILIGYSVMILLNIYEEDIVIDI
jgi:hypothetical protein